VAAHSWGLAWLVLLLCPEDLDRDRAVAMAIVHDLPEVIVGDITPHDGISGTQKARQESAAADRLLGQSPYLRDLWQEYADHDTPESKLVHQLDKLDMALQAIRYHQDTSTDTAEFIRSAMGKLNSAQQELLRSVLPASLSDPE
jgi:5'-deoxynucleotidase YfbR-like HD superfamily hydrolase